jgi:glycolate oxidase FAD binding subunit
VSPATRRLPSELESRVVGELAPHPRAAALPLVVPRNEDELGQALKAASRDALTLVPCGGGSRLAWTRPPERADFVLSVRALTGAIAHEPDDGTLTARAGTPLAALRELAASGGHWCTPDVPRPATTTLGSVLALGLSGADRTRHAPLRNHVLGMTVVLADGTLAKSGGRLVKNVTGYDLHRLYTGSHGTLAVIVSASLRLFPAAESEAWLERETATFDDALDVARRASELPARWLSLSILRRDGRWSVAARLAGKRAVVEHELREARDCLGEPRARDADAVRLANAARDASPSAGTSFARVGCRPSRLAEVARLVASALGDARIEPALASLEFSLARPAEDVAALRPELARLDASLHVVAPASEVEPFDAPGPELALMRRLKDQLDPRGVFARGRFVGGL